jgi:hypothetical protein
VPERTFNEKTGNVQWEPVPYPVLGGAVNDIYTAVVGTPCVSADFVLRGNKWGAPGAHEEYDYPGAQVFGSFSWANPERDGTMLTVVVRSSLNQSIAPTAANGLHTMVCANMCISGDNMVWCKQTTNVAGKVVAMIEKQANDLVFAAREMAARLDHYAEAPCSQNLFYALSGILQGYGFITPTMGNKARRYWDRSHSSATRIHGMGLDQRIEEHGQGTMESALQAVTGSLHLVSPTNVMRRHAQVIKVLDGAADGRLGSHLDDAVQDALRFTIPEFAEA